MSAFSHNGSRMPLLAKVHRKLIVGSAISAQVAHARGYKTVQPGAALANAGFLGAQATSGGLLVPVWWGGAKVLDQLRPDKPRHGEDGKPIKYETPAKKPLRLDCSPVVADDLHDPTVPLWVTEGVRKGDAAASAGMCCIALLGVWAWKHQGKPLEDWGYVELSNREVFIAYDSDVMTKDSVRGALEQLTVFLIGRGARVRWVFLPPGSDPMGKAVKVGLDDYLADDNSPDELLALSERPQVLGIRVGNRQLRETTADAVAALALANEPPVVFQRAEQLVEAQADGVAALGAARLQYRLANAADWFKVLRDGSRVAQQPDKTTVQNVAVAVERWPFPVLDRVVSTPVFAGDGSLRTDPGYHPASRTLFQPPAGLTVPTVPAAPTPADVQQARTLVEEMFCEFPFATPSDRAHAWALFLQPFARELIRGETPMFGVEAPKQGTGKTLLVRSALAAAMGHLATGSDPRNDDEMRKRITAGMVAAEQAVVFDNVIKRVDYPSLASALTSQVWHDRVLGETRNVSAPIYATWVLTGNNPQYSDDIARRVVPIRLDSREEHPHLRTQFTKSLPAWALERRGELVWAACVLIRAWLLAGRPGPDPTVPGLGSYGPWRYVLGGLLALQDVPGLLGNLHKPSESSPETEALQALLGIVNSPHKVNKPDGQPFTSSELALWVQDDPDLVALVCQQYGGTVAQQVGKFLTGHRDQVVGGHRLIKGGRVEAGWRWQFVPEDTAP